jgi:general transcription factor 3C polypeptide 3 (transcription factor C subunit 4)
MLMFCRALGYNQQALYCYRILYNFHPGNVNVLLDRTLLAKEMGDLGTVHLHSFPSRQTLNSISRLAIRTYRFSVALCRIWESYDHFWSNYSTSKLVLLFLICLHELFITFLWHCCTTCISFWSNGSFLPSGSVQRKAIDGMQDRGEKVSGTCMKMIGSLIWWTVMRVRQLGRGMEVLDPDVNARHHLAIARIKIKEGKVNTTIFFMSKVPLQLIGAFLR